MHNLINSLQKYSAFTDEMAFKKEPMIFNRYENFK